MENPCKLLLFGDSITKGYTPLLEKRLRTDYPEIDLTVINAGIVGETSRDGLKRLPQLLDEKHDVVVIGFGMNDWRKGVDKPEYKENLLKIINAFENIGSRVIINTVSPSYDFENQSYNSQVDEYSRVVRQIAYEKRIKVADINALWKREIEKPEELLKDNLHPNKNGYDLLVKCLMWVVPRKNTTVLWQYNSREAKCNYRCPYCYYIGLHSPKDRFLGTIDDWHNGFKEAFGNQNIIFYLAFGEPAFGEKFTDILKMIDSEKKWQLRITSNVSYKLEEIVQSKSAKEGRININASFHPCMTDRNKFSERILFLRKHDIEVPIIYVAYPPYLKHFEDDIMFFRNHGFVVHVRRLQGKYQNKLYPYAYTPEEAKLITKYSDDGTIKYMLNQQTYHGELTYAGTHFFIVDNVGNIGYDSNIFRPYTEYRCIFGNIHQNNFRPLLLPGPYPGQQVGTVDGIANIISNNYKELENNNVTCFARQGRVYKDIDGNVIYGNEFKDFDDPIIRAEYNFPSLASFEVKLNV